MRIADEFPREIEVLDPVFIELSDGARLAARIWLPKDAGEQPVPDLHRQRAARRPRRRRVLQPQRRAHDVGAASLHHMDIPNRLSNPTAEHWAGTDQLGRDTFSRVLHGGRVALKVAAVGVSVSLAVGLLLGMLAGFGP